MSGVNSWRDYELHKARKMIQSSHHDTEIKMMKDHHEKEENLAKQIYLVEKFTEIEQHFQQLNADLLTVSKESGKHVQLFKYRHEKMSSGLNKNFCTEILFTMTPFHLLQSVICSTREISNFLQFLSRLLSFFQVSVQPFLSPSMSSSVSAQTSLPSP